MTSRLLVEQVPDEPHGDIPHDEEALRGFRRFLDGAADHFDVEVISPINQDAQWVRVCPVEYGSSPDADSVWNIGHGTCQRLDDNRQPYGATGTCNGYITTVPSPGHTIGKLEISIS